MIACYPTSTNTPLFSSHHFQTKEKSKYRIRGGFSQTDGISQVSPLNFLTFTRVLRPNRTLPAVVKKKRFGGLTCHNCQFSPHFGRNCPPQHRTPPPPASANGSSSSCLITSDSPDYNLFHNQVLGRTLEPVTPGPIFVQSRYVFARILKVD